MKQYYIHNIPVHEAYTTGKELPAVQKMQEMQVQFLGQEGHLD